MPVAGSHATGSGETNKSSLLHKAVGECPEDEVGLSGTKVKCLVDTGAQVSTVTESFFYQYLAEREELVDVSAFIKIILGMLD